MFVLLTCSGQAVGRGKVLGIKLPSTLRTVGYFKGLIRIIKSADVPPPFDMRKLFVPRPYVVRVYVMDGDHVQPSDGDPFLKLKLGNVKIDDSEHHCKKTFQPEFFRSYELSATLPGPSRLDIELWDYDKFSANDFIGRTTIDIEDR